jgi:hypothetical protein
LKNKAPKKIFSDFFGYSFSDGVKLSKHLSSNEIKTFADFNENLSKVIPLISLETAYYQIGLQENEPYLIVSNCYDSSRSGYQKELSDYFKGVVGILK